MTVENYFNNQISNSEHFIDMPDCIADGDSYKETLANSFKITNGILNLDAFKWSENDTEYLFDLIINNESRKLSVKKISDYVDSEGLVQGLNQILGQSSYDGNKHFCDINGGVADFGIAFITKEKEIELAKSGLIWRNEGYYHAIQEINNQIILKPEHIDEEPKSKSNTIKPWWQFWK